MITDINDRNQKVRWDVELCHWENYLKKETKIIRKEFDTKVQAQEFIQNSIDTLPVVSIVVNRLTYANINWQMLPSRKRMYEHDF